MNRLANPRPHLLQISRAVMEVLPLVPAERGLEREHVRDPQVPPERDPRGPLLDLLHAEAAVPVGEAAVLLGEHVGELAGGEGQLLVVAAVDEHVLLFAVAVKVHVEDEVLVAGEAHDEALAVVDFWVQLAAGVLWVRKRGVPFISC